MTVDISDWMKLLFLSMISFVSKYTHSRQLITQPAMHVQIIGVDTSHILLFNFGFLGTGRRGDKVPKSKFGLWTSLVVFIGLIKTYFLFWTFWFGAKNPLRRPNFRYWGGARPGTRRDFFVSRSWKTGSHNRLGQMRSFDILKIHPTVSEIHCTRKVLAYVRTCVRTLRGQWILETVGQIFEISKDLIWHSLLWEPVFQDRLVPGRALPQYLKFGLRRVFFAPNQKVQKRQYVFISPINTTRLVQSPNFDFGTLSPPSIYMYVTNPSVCKRTFVN